jgi:hypothetical protein
MLPDVAAEIEHSLMVQYLFAASSLGGSQVPAQLRTEVRAWQETILGVANEEMGHPVTVQNLHIAVGVATAPRPRGLCAESPDRWSGHEADEIRARAAKRAGAQVNRVGVL